MGGTVLAAVVLAIAVGVPSLEAASVGRERVIAVVADHGHDAAGPVAETGRAPRLQQDFDDDDHHHDWDWGWGWWIFMPVMMLLFWGGLIAAVVWGIRQFTRHGRPGRPLDIARERLARGEITKEEFDRIRADLE